MISIWILRGVTLTMAAFVTYHTLRQLWRTFTDRDESSTALVPPGVSDVRVEVSADCPSCGTRIYLLVDTEDAKRRMCGEGETCQAESHSSNLFCSICGAERLVLRVSGSTAWIQERVMQPVIERSLQ